MQTLNFKTPIRQSLIAAGVMFLLALPIIGFKLEESDAGLILMTRFDWVWQSVFAAFALTYLAAITGQYMGRRHASSDAVKIAIQKIQSNGLWVGLLAVIGAVVLPFLPFADRYVIDLATTILIYIMLGWGLNIVVGLAGLLDLGYVAFYAIGAYAYALCAEYLGLSFWQCLPISAIAAVLFSLLIGGPVLRLRGDYLAIVTLGFGEILRIILINWQNFTHGPNGVTGIPRPNFFGLIFAREAPEGTQTFHQFFNLEYNTEHRLIYLYFLILILALLTNFVAMRLRRLPLGRAWEAIKQDEIACKALGINPASIKLSAYAIGALLAGIAGAFFATRQGFISPESFSFSETAIIVAIVVLAGAGSQIGIVMAAMFLVLLPELGREFADFRMLFFGAVMVLIMLWRPRGLFADRTPSIEIGGQK
ncbi:MAG: high-affinity branched-chain amino acid ABC transporter permease LivM [Alphaproteobacteria bacterium]|nr:MAG: high-affinity branched-chain amino acid ABC transporter permease LivM [Alphaproteobacteria bacterium]